MTKSQDSAVAATASERVAHAVGGDRRAIAQLISALENDEDGAVARELSAILATYAGNAHVVGITGSPGVGKSTCVSALVACYRQRGARVGVLAIDPASPFSGGALLGDRVRMQDHALDSEVFIRSMSSRGALGGLAAAAPRAVRVLDAVGCDVVLIETVGVGQAEVEVAALADTTVVMAAPGLGDGIQAAKAGIIEIADIFAVNKSDRDGAQAVVRDLKGMLALGGRHSVAGSWRPRIVSTVASRGDGIDGLVVAIAEHGDWLDKHGERARRRHARVVAEITAVALARLRSFIVHSGASTGGSQAVGDTARATVADVDALADAVLAGEMSSHAAADSLISALNSRG